ncbi:SGNH/GDSL hydrolase family protein [Salipiger marinus]|uniref:SGNH/GDSL hydrolase family protein n=1 Tax=Salipiger marinus TaxID=555512 RepID=UPI002BB4D6D9|nr:SGNH/GDSL hydrolase family protein [Salipiger manganoxidans]MEB3421722.1 SGNH/GDSL hydrolase family protein [Salipiger manganoxidans]
MTFTLPVQGTDPKTTTVADLERAVTAAIEAVAGAAAMGFPLYGSVAAGLAATDAGAGFAVFDASALSLYLNADGASDLQGRVPLASVTDGLTARLELVEAGTEYASIVRSLWAELALLTPAGIGQRAEVLDGDIGAHTDPDSGATVQNAGLYTAFGTAVGEWTWLQPTTIAGKLSRSENLGDLEDANEALANLGAASQAAMDAAEVAIADKADQSDLDELTEVVDSKADGADVEALKNDNPQLARNELRNSAFTEGLLGTIDPNDPLVQLPSFTVTRAGVGAVYPSTLELVDDQANDIWGSNRAVEMTMVRSGDGAVNTDFQLRQMIAIPEKYLGRAALSVYLVFYYKRDTTNITAIGVALGYTDGGETYVGQIGLTNLYSDEVVGEYTKRVLRANIADPTVTHILIGPRFQTTTATVDFSGTAHLGGIGVHFERPELATWEPGIEARAEVAAADLAHRYGDVLRNPGLQMANPITNARLIDAEVGSSIAPAGWSAASGGGGTTPATWQIVDTPTDLPRTVPENMTAKFFETTHFNNGTVRTDQQFITSIPVADDMTGKFRVVFLARRSSVHVDFTVLCRFRDDEATSLGDFLLTRINTDQPAVDEWTMLVFEGEFDEPTAASLEFTFRTQVASDSGVVSDITTYQGLFAVYTRGEQIAEFQRNFEDDVTRIATIAVGVQTAVNANDRVITSTGIAHLVLPLKKLLAPGDSQTAGMGSGSTVFPEEIPDYDFLNWGIGSETSTQILARVIGFAPNTAGLGFATTGTKRLRARKTVPPRTISEAYRSSWESFGARIAEPYAVEFHSKTGLIGVSFQRYKATATVSGDTLTSAGHPFQNGDEVYFIDASYPANAYRYKVYYVRDVSGDTFKLAEFSGGAAITFDTFGGSLTLLGDWYFDWPYVAGQDSTISLITHCPTDDYVHHICVGTNDFSDATTAAEVFENIRLMVRQIKSANGRFIISGIPGFYSADGSWGIGGSKYVRMLELWDMISSVYPDNSLDIYSYLLTQGDGGTDDNADIASGYVPRSLRNSATDGHLSSSVGSPIWQAEIARIVNEKGWT